MYIYGRNPVLEALRSGDQIEKIYILYGRQGGPMNEIFTLAKQRGVGVVITPKDKFFEIVSTLGEQVTHQGVLARRSEITFAEIDDIIALAAQKKENVFMVL
ncbi:MAG TPA: RNA methyltransferase substrate-binding domain-containing protein, partial [Candidatus Kapabacteria bacterium]|nr:RNA methyltransferase substrate-binding domain-containing protein [Candidatus Kapabacteria bacterium]